MATGRSSPCESKPTRTCGKTFTSWRMPGVGRCANYPSAAPRSKMCSWKLPIPTRHEKVLHTPRARSARLLLLADRLRGAAVFSLRLRRGFLFPAFLHEREAGPVLDRGRILQFALLLVRIRPDLPLDHDAPLRGGI